MLKFESICITSPFDSWYLLEMHQQKAFNSLDTGTLLCMSNQAHLNQNDFKLKPIQWSVTNSNEDTQYFTGLVQEVIAHPALDQSHGYALYTLKVTNILGIMLHKKRSRSWYQKTVAEILEDIFTINTFVSMAYDATHVQSLNKTIEYTVQFNQTDYDFLQCFCAEHGIVFLVKPNDDYIEHVYLFDKISAYQMNNMPLQYSSDGFQSEQTKPLVMRNIMYQNAMHPTQFHSFDYNPFDLKHDLHQHYHLPNEHNKPIGPVETFPNLTKQLQPLQYQIKSQANQVAQQAYTVSCQTNWSAIALGDLFKIDTTNSVNSDQLGKEIMPIRVTHHARNYEYGALSNMVKQLAGQYSTFSQSEKTNYYNDIEYVPWQQKIYLPSLNTKHKAGIPCTMSGFVVGAEGETVDTDQYGRVKVWMPWDENNPDKDHTQCPWVRVIHRQDGMQWIPHIGDEVLLSAQNQQLNQPIIIGSLYNENNPAPFNLEQNPTLTGIKAARDASSEPHLFYSNNKMNEEEIIIQSNKDLIKIVGNDLDKETCLYLKQVAQDFMQLVEGNITIKVTDGSIDIQAEQAINLQVNGNQILIEPHQVQINGDEIFLNTLSGMHGELVAVGNNHTCPKRNDDGTRHVGGPVTSGSPNVMLNGKPAARVGDTAKCHGATDTITQGNSCIYINGKKAAIVNSITKHNGHISEGVVDITAGGGSIGQKDSAWKSEALNILGMAAGTAIDIAGIPLDECGVGEAMQVAGTDIIEDDAASTALNNDSKNVLKYESLKAELRRNMSKPIVSDESLQRFINKLYREDAEVGSGSTADAIRYEQKTGNDIKGKYHMQKGMDAIKYLKKWRQMNPNASSNDTAAVENILHDLSDAID